MNIHEYQGKELLAQFGVATPKGQVAFNLDEVRQAAEALGGPVWVVKSQIHAGGRGAGHFKHDPDRVNGGGVKVVVNGTIDEVVKAAENMLGNVLVTKQTGPEGKQVNRLLIADGVDIERELYLALLVDRGSSRVTIVASQEGGMEIEEVAAESPEKIIQVSIDPATGIQGHHCRTICFALGLTDKAQMKSATAFLQGMYQAFVEKDCAMVEINPLVVTKQGEVSALDAKVSFDDNALFRHRDVQDMRDESEEEASELEAVKWDLNYVKLDGEIGCMVNGAGLAMATMDIIKLYGSEPANFLDVGGGATEERVKAAFGIITRDPNVKGILVNIFGGIMKCDIIAKGVVAAVQELGLNVPLVVRLEGTNVELGKQIMAESGLNIIPADNLADAAEKITQAVKGA